MADSLSHFARAQEVLPGGVNSSTRLSKALEMPFYASRGRGSRVWDIEDREFIDMSCAHGAGLLGNAHSTIDEALRQAAEMGYISAFETAYHEELARLVCEHIPAGRVGKVTDVAPLFLFLASDDAEYITGQTFVVDGGQLSGQKPSEDLLRTIKL